MIPPSLAKGRQAGFTLVELAISLTIIGILIAAVLKGEELLDNSRVTQTIRQVRSYNAASTSFEAVYGAIAGDILKPTRIPNCSVSPCTLAGDGNSLVGNEMAAPLAMTPYFRTSLGWNDTKSVEERNFWLHLLKAGFITGVGPEGAAVSPFKFGDQIPAAPIRGTGFYMRSLQGPASAPYRAFRGSFIWIVGVDGVGALPSNIAAQIDTKSDDGKPYTGDTLIGPNDGSVCRNGSDYDVSGATKCDLLFALD